MNHKQLVKAKVGNCGSHIVAGSTPWDATRHYAMFLLEMPRKLRSVVDNQIVFSG
jgi:hypothetical protein